ncbi:DUF234 domain-containing protein [Nonomuraea sp. NPDC046570]|uniref:ATP-binding protein n=1 Tax=Nonomuraea sp. NPDC046570 TaxID=3155255 RepID=UPI0033FF2A15
MAGFIGRKRELASLNRLLSTAAAGGRLGRPGRAILMRGRRRVGKSRLAEEFVARSGLPHLFFAANTRPTRMQLQRFQEVARRSTLPGADLFDVVTPDSWEAALRLLVDALPQDSPSVVVIDELPFLISGDPSLEGTLQELFDREFSRRPVLLLLIGSDLSMMEAINQYDRPFYLRATDMLIHPLTPADVGELLDLGAPEAFDAHLISGGFPHICEEWPVGASLWEYLERSVPDPISALAVSGERSLAAEFPPEAQARDVLSVIGAGQRTFSSISRATGGMPQASLSRALRVLLEKRMIVSEAPLSGKPSREHRYHVADPHLRFWLPFIEPYLPEIERGRGDLVVERIRRSWPSWRGMAVEPVIRESLRRMDGLPEGTGAIGGYWTRTNDPEIDIVGADREPVARRITMAGSIKWLENRPFDQHDLSELVVRRAKLPGADSSTPLYAVSRSGCVVEGVSHVTPGDLIDAWRG